jgi:hypothetical protein
LRDGFSDQDAPSTPSAFPRVLKDTLRARRVNHGIGISLCTLQLRLAELADRVYLVQRFVVLIGKYY